VNNLTNVKLNFCCSYFLISLALGLLGVQTVQAQARFGYSSDIAEVTDRKTGLIWQRCSSGQAWNVGTATCTGTAVTYTHEAALVYAQTQTGWRLPNVKELSSIADRTRNSPAIDVAAFPVTPSPSRFWTSTPYAGDPVVAWTVAFSDGTVDYGYRTALHHVRLVR
jgi:hypothetical protein